MRDIKVNEKLVGDVNIWGNIGRLDEARIEVNRDGDAAQLLFQSMSLVAFLHIEDGWFIGMKDVVLVDSLSISRECDTHHEQAIEFVRLQ
jgi:hypothetical protein